MTATLGIDIGSKPKRTAIALIRWDTSPATLLELAVGTLDGTPFHDKFLSTSIRNLTLKTDGVQITKTGIDAPFGWPAPFVEAIAQYGDGGLWPSPIDFDRDAFYRRKTDELVAASTGRQPLAVSVDKIGYCAIRAAVLLSDIAYQDGRQAVPRDGSGVVCEVYPDPAVRHWTRKHPAELGKRESYKGKDNVARREQLLDAFLESVPLDDPKGLLRTCRNAVEDDYLDALICAFVARATELGQTRVPVTDEERSAAASEGWIHVPTEPLSALAR